MNRDSINYHAILHMLLISFYNPYEIITKPKGVWPGLIRNFTSITNQSKVENFIYFII